MFGYVIERLLDAGALDVFGTAVQMKKNRPGHVAHGALPSGRRASVLRKLLFAETTTLGIRMRQERRQVLARRTVAVNTQWGEVRMKVANLNGTVANYAPEYEDCRRIAADRHGSAEAGDAGSHAPLPAEATSDRCRRSPKRS